MPWAPGHHRFCEAWKSSCDDPLPSQMGPGAGEVLSGVRDDLLWLARALGSDTKVLVGGWSGTCSLDMILGSLPRRSRCLGIVNGFFGRRLVEIAELHGHEVSVLELSRETPLAARHLPALLRLVKDSRADVLMGVHAETETGIVNNLGTIVSVSQASQILSIVDGISAIGGIEVDLARDPVDFYVGSAYKCLACPPTLSFVLAKSTSLPSLSTRYSYALDLQRLAKRAEQDRSLWTPSALSLRVLRSAIREIREVGPSEYFSGIQSRGSEIRRRIRKAGISVFGPEASLHPCFSTLVFKRRAQQVAQTLRSRFGIEVGIGIGVHSESEIRIAHYAGLGSPSDSDIRALIDALHTLEDY